MCLPATCHACVLLCAAGGYVGFPACFCKKHERNQSGTGIGMKKIPPVWDCAAVHGSGIDGNDKFYHTENKKATK